MGANPFFPYSPGETAGVWAGAGLEADAPLEFAFLVGGEDDGAAPFHALPADLQDSPPLSFGSAGIFPSSPEGDSNAPSSGSLPVLQRSDGPADAHCSTSSLGELNFSLTYSPGSNFNSAGTSALYFSTGASLGADPLRTGQDSGFDVGTFEAPNVGDASLFDLIVAPPPLADAQAQRLESENESAANGTTVSDAASAGEFETRLDETLPVEWQVKRIPPEGEGLQTVQSSSLIRLTNMRADSRFAGIDGSGFSVVVIDTGADLNHPAFGPDSNGDGVADRIVFQYDFSGANDSNATDTKGHGTNVAGIVGSQNASYPGMAPGVNLIILKVFPDNSDNASSTDIEEAARWVVNNAAAYNIVSVNLSLGSGNFNSAQTTYLHDEFQSLRNLGIAPVVATGNSFYAFNSAPGVAGPAADSLAWGVGAVYDANLGQVSFQSGATDFGTAPDRITSFTQRTTVPGLVDIFAPGGAITNAFLGDSTETLYGTSMAAPHIAGIVALAQEYATQLSGSRLSVDTLLSLIRSSAVTVVDGDDENDNVINTGGSFPRVDVYSLMEAILNHFGSVNNPGSVSINDASITEGNSALKS